jgi:hypothetical protein
MVRQGETPGPRRNPVHHRGHGLRQREAGADVRDVDDLPGEHLAHEPFRHGVAHVRQAHGGDVVRVGDDAVREQGVERGLDARCGPAFGQHAPRHEPHHLGVAHAGGVAQAVQALEGKRREPGAPDRREIGAAPLDEQHVGRAGGPGRAELDRRVFPRPAGRAGTRVRSGWRGRRADPARPPSPPGHPPRHRRSGAAPRGSSHTPVAATGALGPLGVARRAP